MRRILPLLALVGSTACTVAPSEDRSTGTFRMHLDRKLEGACPSGLTLATRATVTVRHAGDDLAIAMTLDGGGACPLTARASDWNLFTVTPDAGCTLVPKGMTVGNGDYAVGGDKRMIDLSFADGTCTVRDLWTEE